MTERPAFKNSPTDKATKSGASASGRSSKSSIIDAPAKKKSQRWKDMNRKDFLPLRTRSVEIPKRNNVRLAFEVSGQKKRQLRFLPPRLPKSTSVSNLSPIIIVRFRSKFNLEKGWRIESTEARARKKKGEDERFVDNV